MNEEVEKQAIGRPDTIVDEHSTLVELAIKMQENWRTLLLHRPDERAWAKLEPEELEDMHTKIAGWIQTCSDVLAVCPSPPKKNNIAEDWQEALIRKNKEIRALIDKKRGVI